MKTRIWIPIASHLATGLVAFAAGIYVLPIVTASEGASAVELQVAAENTRHTGRFERGLPGSDLLHWADGKLTITDSSIAFEGDVAPGPDYKIYLVPEFVDTKASFLAIKARAARVADLKTFGNFVVPLPADVNPAQYTSVVIWCERFSKFISAARYRSAAKSGSVSM
ncbi:DM13 domain-containing protein [Burkholderia metallica]|uniref:DM13 domain-containing protein n=1 Tax=Burkholderia metallica TaxID=488729 RepID=A0ABT8PC15_9BURK|nr:DM13 domain-containing protein [Burkholderia metallica]MDN7932387.1 DM13 domain-containing protein [Burkholderia metallica]